MIAYKGLLAVSLPILAAVACGTGGTVARFAPCGSTDTCPQSTVCEAVETTSMGTTTGPTLCTWSCNNNDFGGQSCPTDANGSQGICVISIGNTPIGHEDDFGFCFQDCSSGGTCPDGMGVVGVTGTTGSTNRMNCASSSDDASGETGDYDDAVNGHTGAAYVISGATMTLTGGEYSGGVTPDTDTDMWTFTKM